MDGGLGLPLGLGAGRAARPGSMISSRHMRLMSVFSQTEVFLVGFFLRLSLADPLGPVGQILQGCCVLLGILQGL